MMDSRGKSVVAASFVFGLLCAGFVTGPDLDTPAVEPYFDLDEPGAAAEPALAPTRPAATHECERPPVGDLAHLAAALADQPPERLALETSGRSPLAVVAAQAIPLPVSPPTYLPVPVPEPPIAATLQRTSADVSETATMPDPVPAPAAVPSSTEPERLQTVVPSSPPTAAPAPGDDLKALVARVQQSRTSERLAAKPGPAPTHAAAPPTAPVAAAGPPAAAATTKPAIAPLPGEAWTDPDSINWADAAPERQPTNLVMPEAARRRGLFPERRPEQRGLGLGIGQRDAAGQQPVLGGRLLDRLRGDRRSVRMADAGTSDETPHVGRWPTPTRLSEQLRAATAATHPEVRGWASTAVQNLDTVVASRGPADTTADETLLTLGDTARAAMTMADGITDPAVSADTRRLALAIERRVAVWRAAAALCAETTRGPESTTSRDVDLQLAAGQTDAETSRLLEALEQFEAGPTPAHAATITSALAAIRATSFSRAKDLVKAVGDHYLAPNVRVAVHQQFVERMLPEATVDSGPMQDFVLGRKVRGTRTVEQSTTVRFLPDADEIRFELLVNGEVDSRTVTESGPVAIHTRGAASFTVRKPVSLSTAGLTFGNAMGRASNDSRVAGIETNFDGVPIMGPLMRNIARSQVDESREEAAREVNGKIIVRACREVDQQAEPKFTEIAARIRARLWEPLVRLGLDPQPVALETTDTQATVRLRLAASTQLAAHTPRPRAPADAMLSMQVHQSTLNNTCERFALAGRSVEVQELIREVCGKLGVEPRLPDDMPEGVNITFAAEQPLRVECREGLIHVRIALDAIESGRRNWYDIVAHVAYRPKPTGLQVALEREGPVQLSGPNHQGRLEIPLRTIFGKIFPKERPIPLLPPTIVENPRLAAVKAVQATCADGWFALALAEQAAASAKAATAALPLPVKPALTR